LKWLGSEKNDLNRKLKELHGKFLVKESDIKEFAKKADSSESKAREWVDFKE